MRGVTDPQRWAKSLADEALGLDSSDNISILIVVLNERAIYELGKQSSAMEKRKRHLALSPRSSSPQLKLKGDNTEGAESPPSNFTLKFRRDKKSQKRGHSQSSDFNSKNSDC